MPPPKTPSKADEASEPLPVAAPAPARKAEAEDTWAVEEHIRAAEALYSQPPWLLQALLGEESMSKQMTKAQVQEKIDAYNERPIYGGS